MKSALFLAAGLAFGLVAPVFAGTFRDYARRGPF